MKKKKETKKQDVKAEKEKKDVNPYMPVPFKIDSVVQETFDIKTYKVKFNQKCLPGQFVEVMVPSIGECAISVCSYSDSFIELCVRNVGNVTNAMHKMKAKDEFLIRGPYGNGYPMKDIEGQNLVLVGGGTGIAPLRSVIQYIEKNKDRYGKVDIFMGYRSPEFIMFRKDMERWKKEFNLKVTVDKAEGKWNGNVGLITDLLEKSQVSIANTTVLTCGPPIMIKFVIKVLKKLGFGDHQIYVSLERNMKCGIGKCGHCMIESEYVCKDGPVFNYGKSKYLVD